VRVSDRTPRQQTKWVVFGFALALTGAGGAITLTTFVPAFRQHGSLGELVAETLTYGFILFLPLSIGVAILRSRLYDIDVVINRTLVYGSLTAVLTASYAGGIVVLQHFFRVFTPRSLATLWSA
jgi:hypothetical protein